MADAAMTRDIHVELTNARDAMQLARRAWWRQRLGNVRRSWSASFVIAAADRKVDR